MEVIKLTGKFYLKKRFFGGYKVMVEAVCHYFCEHDFSYSPEFTTYIKATDEQLLELRINALWKH